jgi:two-component system, OmpR family, phosphate regulon sensor histidine kinase PhoR
MSRGLHRTLFASYLAVIAAVMGAGTVVFAISESGSGRALLLGGVAAVALAALFAVRARARVARPLTAMAVAAQRIAEGDFVAAPVRITDDEIGDLAAALSEVSRRLAGTVRELTSERDKLRAVLAGMSEGVALVARGRIVLANPAFSKLIGAIGPVEGRTPLEASRLPELAEAVSHASAGRASGGRDASLGPRIVHLYAEPIDRGAGVVLVLLDVTEARSLERMRRDFVANASHELRTPVAAIRGVVETLLAAPDMGAADRERFEKILAAHVDRLSRLVNDLLDLSHAEAGGPRLRPVRLPLTEPAELAVAAVRHRSEAKRVRIALSIDGVEIEADPIAVEQVLTNLLDNAVKYSPEGGRIDVRAARDGDRVRIEVQDAGPGIAAEHLPRLFERFYRVDPARSRAQGGTGLGLAIVKHLVQAHGGEVSVASEVGRGTTFRVSFPAPR